MKAMDEWLMRHFSALGNEPVGRTIPGKWWALENSNL